MKEYKIVYDAAQKEPWRCYGRGIGSILTYLFDEWELLASTSTKEEALIFIQSETGKFIGVFYKDGKKIPDNTQELYEFENVFIPQKH
jgi:hypothetical protein